ncbi:uncharacterized protein LOC143693390 [Agelaius phoeniceus]|uniref:uncharacterized protein LOC143693390 n=1 Tax=Agelaius phoeniceus TaxID=39638 RepID=UPI00405504DD
MEPLAKVIFKIHRDWGIDCEPGDFVLAVSRLLHTGVIRHPEDIFHPEVWDGCTGALAEEAMSSGSGRSLKSWGRVMRALKKAQPVQRERGKWKAIQDCLWEGPRQGADNRGSAECGDSQPRERSSQLPSPGTPSTGKKRSFWDGLLEEARNAAVGSEAQSAAVGSEARGAAVSSVVESAVVSSEARSPAVNSGRGAPPLAGKRGAPPLTRRCEVPPLTQSPREPGRGLRLMCRRVTSPRRGAVTMAARSRWGWRSGAPGVEPPASQPAVANSRRLQGPRLRRAGRQPGRRGAAGPFRGLVASGAGQCGTDVGAMHRTGEQSHAGWRESCPAALRSSGGWAVLGVLTENGQQHQWPGGQGAAVISRFSGFENTITSCRKNEVPNCIISMNLSI